MNTREQMNIVVIGHVDHGKSTVIGRLLADTGSLPQGKLDQVKATCQRNARPFEYAFLLDALKDEQAQGITIDTARCFFKTDKRDYIIIDAPGHIEFLKNMISGAARAEAALLVIDAHEGIMENSKRHGYLASMLGIKQLVVLVNKMDLIDFDQARYDSVVNTYGLFLKKLGTAPVAFIPICARSGDNLAQAATSMPWYRGQTVLSMIDTLKKQSDVNHKPLRLPIQDIYKFTANNDDRRIFAGTIQSGTLNKGDRVVFRPSGKQSTVTSIEAFNRKAQTTVLAGQATGITIADELYVQRGELLCRENEQQPVVAARFKANVFWMGRVPLQKNKKYKLKIATARVAVQLVEVVACIDAADLGNSTGKQHVDRHDVAECVFETARPVAFDPIDEIEATGRFVIVDNYDIAGGGIITAVDTSAPALIGQHIQAREQRWDKGEVSDADRQQLFGHKSKLIIITGKAECSAVARQLEQELIQRKIAAYYLGMASLVEGLTIDVSIAEDRYEQIKQLGELGRIITGAGIILIIAIDNLDEQETALLRRLNEPNQALVVSIDTDQKPDGAVDLYLNNTQSRSQQIAAVLHREQIIADYTI